MDTINFLAYFADYFNDKIEAWLPFCLYKNP
jgi:hypothetical protein